MAGTPRSRRLASSSGSAIAVWDPAQVSRLARPTGIRVPYESFAVPVPTFAVTPDGSRIAIFDDSDQQGDRIYDLRTGRLLATLEGMFQTSFAEWSEDGAWLVGVGSGGGGQVWDLRGSSPRLVAAWPADDRASQAGAGISALHVLAGQRRLTLVDTRGSVVVRDLTNGRVVSQRQALQSTDPARRSGAWSRSSIWSILRNPKYTGFQVYNRRASRTRRGRPNDPKDWTWSTEPAHPAIITTDEFRQVDAVAAGKARSRRTNAPARPDPRPDQYLFHGMVRCACGLRMRGCRRKQTILYYQCQPERLRGRPLSAGHPSGIYVAEAALLDGVTGFLARAVYGPERAGYWESALSTTDAPDPAAPARARAAELEREIADLHSRLRRQVLALEDEQTAPEALPPIVERISELRRDLADRQAALVKLDGETPPPSPDPAVVGELLATLPLYGDDLRALPAKRLRELLESLHLAVSYDHKEHTVQIEITLAALVGQGDHQVVPLVCSGGTEQTRSQERLCA